MAGIKRKTETFKMLVAPRIKDMITEKAESMMISRADYLVSLVMADNNGAIDWGRARGAAGKQVDLAKLVMEGGA